MIAWSDNTATNLLVHLVGTANVDKRLDSYGLTKTRLYRPTFRDGHADVLPEEEKEFGLGSTTPHEAARLLELVAQGQAVDRASSDEMLGLLSRQQDRAMIPRSLPFEREEILVANRTGWDEEKQPDAKGFKGDVRCDAAYVKSPKARYVIAICARQIQDKSPGVDNEALRTGAELSRIPGVLPGGRHFFASSEAQLTTTVIGSAASSGRRELTRKRWPSAVTS
jgi:beta-lactamase class A